ncbi:MAG: hypothetical protein ACTSPY_01605 [Candidatus Helarchaeota archaeon]
MENLTIKIRELVANIAEDMEYNSIFEYKTNTEVSELFNELPKEFLSKDQVSLVLSDDTYLQLGNSQVPSCKLLVPVIDPDQINNGKISVIGPELSNRFPVKTTLPFSQIIFIYTNREIDPDLYRKMYIHLSVFNIINGFMIRAVPRKFWIRINKEIINSGFNLEILGKFLIFHMKSKFLEISKIEIIFITTSPDKIEDLGKISIEIQEIYSDTEIRKKLKEIEKGQIPPELLDDKKRFDCDYEWSCNDCEYNEICDEILDIIKKMREYKKKNK